MKRNLFFIALLAFASLAFAQPQQSTNFRIAKSVLDAGGGSSTSTNFKLYSAFGQPTPIGVQTSANFSLSAGYLSPSFLPGSLNPIADLVIQRVGLTNDVKLTWTRVANATSYNIHRGTTSGFVPAGGNLIGTATDSTYTDVGVAATAPTQLFYIVTAQAGSLLLTPINPQLQAVETHNEIAPISKTPQLTPAPTAQTKNQNTAKQVASPDSKPIKK